MDYFLFDFSGVQFHYTMSHYKKAQCPQKEEELIIEPVPKG